MTGTYPRPRQDPRTHQCAVPACGKLVEHDKLMCLPHWRRVPKDIQRKVWDAWRRIHRDRAGYLEVRQEAIDAVAQATFTDRQGSLL